MFWLCVWCTFQVCKIHTLTSSSAINVYFLVDWSPSGRVSNTLRWGTSNVEHLESRLNKLDRFVIKTRDPWPSNRMSS